MLFGLAKLLKGGSIEKLFAAGMCLTIEFESAFCGIFLECCKFHLSFPSDRLLFIVFQLQNFSHRY